MGGGRVFGRVTADRGGGGYGAVLAFASGGAPPHLPPRASARADARAQMCVRGGGVRTVEVAATAKPIPLTQAEPPSCRPKHQRVLTRARASL
jgi:hypothetical protein